MAENVATLMGSHARVAVLRTLLIDPDRPHYQRQIETASGVALRAAQRELERLTDCGVLFSWEEGRRVYYRVDPDSELFRALAPLVSLTLDERERFRAQLAAVEGVVAAFSDESFSKALAVYRGEEPEDVELDGPRVEWMRGSEFEKRLRDDPKSLEMYLDSGEDLLGRRDDVLWHRIAQAGFDVRKGRGVV